MKVTYCDRCGREVSSIEVLYRVIATPNLDAYSFSPHLDDVCKLCVEMMFAIPAKPTLPRNS